MQPPDWHLQLDPPLLTRMRFSGGAQKAGPVSEDRALMARSFAYLFGIGGALLLITLLLPGASDRELAPLIGIGLVAIGVAALCLLGYDRLPGWLFRVLALVGTSLIIVAIVYGGAQASSAYALYFFWVALAAFYFFDAPFAVLCSATSSAGYLAVLILRPGISLPALKWLMLTGALFVAGVLVGRLRSRAESLVEQLADAARTDVLTGLVNRREFDARLGDEVARADRGKRELALVALDLDGLKPINDHHGHHAGDLVLQRVAAVLRAFSRDGDTLARIGGDEFAAIVPDAAAAAGYLLAERLREAVRAVFDGAAHRVTMCAGIAAYPDHAGAAELLKEAADKALYSAKRLGGDCSVIYSDEIATSVAELGFDPARELPSSLEAVISLAQAVDVRQMGSAHHSQTVGRYAEAMGARLGMNAGEVERTRLAGVLHDIGKISIPGAILAKAGPLDKAEMDEMRRHPETGARIARNAQLEDIADWIGAHHERPDGSGYPLGLVGDDIPIEARILAVADAYEAMTNNRAYRPAMSPEQAREELLRNAGTQFDGRVVEVLLELVGDTDLAAA